MQLAEQLNTALADRYRIEREIGSGGMATVYRAHDVRHDRTVALKVLNPELAAVLTKLLEHVVDAAVISLARRDDQVVSAGFALHELGPAVLAPIRRPGV